MQIPTNEQRHVEDAKKSLCYVSLQYNKDRVAAARKPSDFEETYVSRDGKVTLVMGDERFRAPELIFTPKLLPTMKPQRSLQAAVLECMTKTDISIRPKLLQNVVLAGGGSMFKNIAKRVKHELSELIAKDPRGMNTTADAIKVIALENAQQCWRGAALQVRDDKAQGDETRWLSREEYYRQGLASFKHHW